MAIRQRSQSVASRSRKERLPPLEEASLDGFGRRHLEILRDVRASTWFDRTKLPEVCVGALRDLGLDDDRIGYLEAECAMGGFTDHDDHADLRRSVSRRMRTHGVRLGRKKQPLAHRAAFVELVSELLELLGVPFATNVNSPMTKVLATVWEAGLGQEGDPRDGLRRLSKRRQELLKAESEAVDRIFRAMGAALRDEVIAPQAQLMQSRTSSPARPSRHDSQQGVRRALTLGLTQLELNERERARAEAAENRFARSSALLCDTAGAEQGAYDVVVSFAEALRTVLDEEVAPRIAGMTDVAAVEGVLKSTFCRVVERWDQDMVQRLRLRASHGGTTGDGYSTVVAAAMKAWR